MCNDTGKNWMEVLQREFEKLDNYTVEHSGQSFLINIYIKTDEVSQAEANQTCATKLEEFQTSQELGSVLWCVVWR